jgi:predicted membrane protein
MREKINRFMSGRYGADELSRALSVGVLVCFVISMFGAKIPFLFLFYWIGVGLVIYECYRMFSKNISKRYAENQKFLNTRYQMAVKKDRWKKQAAQRKIYRFYKCPDCKQKVRVPKGRGKICITCPKCRREFIKRS